MIKDHFKCGKHNKNDLVNAIFYLNKTGCQWPMLPKDFPPYSTIYFSYRHYKINGMITHSIILLKRLSKS